MLRHTRMPAVRLDAGYLTNAGDASRLRDPAFRDVLAEAIVVAVQRFYLSPDVDAHTGVLRVSEIRDALPGRLRLSRSRADPGAAVRRRGRVPAACRTTAPSSRSRPRSSSSRSDSVVRRSIRIRGLTAWARWVEKPDRQQEVGGYDAVAGAPAGVAERLDRLDPAAQDQVLGHPLHQHPAQSRRRGAPGRRAPSSGSPRRR